jgi:hypothetical protein
MVGSISLASEVSLLLLVPTFPAKTQIKCAKEIVRYLMPTWHDYNDWPQMRYIVHAATAAQIFGGTVIQFRRFAKTGASFLGALISSSPYCAYRKLSLRP